MRSVFAAALLATAFVLPPGQARAAEPRTLATEKHRVQVERIAQVEHPWGIALLPDGRFLVTERNAGTLRIGSRDGTLSAPLAGTPEVFRYGGPTGRSQGGMFHVAAHPDFANNSLVYLSFSQPSAEGAGTALARARLASDGTPRLENVEVIYTMNKHDSSGLHFGGRFVFLPRDNSIVLTVGERRNISRSQDGDDHAGSYIRIMGDGSIPADNPHRDTDKIDDKIFAMGSRNSHGIAVHPATGEIWANEHGPKGGDMLIRVQAGKNYGWPIQTSGTDYSGAALGRKPPVDGFEPPVHVWDRTVAPSGLVVYDGAMFPQWQGHFLTGGLAARALLRTSIENGKVVDDEWMLRDLDRRIRDVAVDRDGAIWVLTEHEDGEILRISAVQE